MNFAILSLSLLLAEPGDGPKVELLWPKGAPGAVGTEAADKPSLSVYLPPSDKATGTAIVVCPGGGYGGLADQHEGKAIGEFLNTLGITAFVLKYRHAPRYQHPAPMNDVQRALRFVRANAMQYAVKPDRIGIMGFSAGGHLASTAAAPILTTARPTATTRSKRSAAGPTSRFCAMRLSLWKSHMPTSVRATICSARTPTRS